MKKIVLITLASAACSTFGNQWRTADGGNFMDAARWNPQTVPSASSEQAWWYIDAQGNYTVTLPEGDWANEAPWRVDVRKETTAFAFDGSKTVWAPSTHASADYTGEPFSFYDLASHYFSFEMYNDKKGAPFKFTHPVFRAEGTGGVSALHFDSGVFNFYDPAGTAHNYDFTIGYGATAYTRVGFHGADVSVANVNIRSSAARTELLVDGGTLDAKTKLEIPTASGGDARTAVDLVVTNTGTLKAGYVTFGYNGKVRDIRVRVADHGRFELPIPADYKFSQQTGGSTLDWEVSNGGTVYLGHNLAFSWGSGCSSVVHLDHGNWLSYNETTVGGDVADATCVFAATNSFIDGYQGNANGMFRLNQDMIVKDSLWTNNFLYAYGANCSPTLLVEGGKWVNLSRLYFGTPNGATMTVDGGDHEWYGQIYVGYEENKVGTVTFKSGKVTMTSSEMIALGYNGTGTFNIDGGELSLPGEGGLSLGHTLPGRGVVRMTGGKLSVPSCETGLVVSRYGAGEFLMEGGEIVLGKGLWFGHVAREVSDTYKGTFWQTGGTVNAAYVNLCHGNAKGELALDGGTFTVGYIESWGGSTAAGGTGWATLSADGGTLRAKFATSGFVQKIDAVKLGTKGLTVDTDYDVTIKQDITAKDANGGKLIKTGRGTLTIDGTIADTIEVIVLEGKVVFGKTSELAALTIGSETSVGAIALGSDAELSVKGDVTIYHNASPDDFLFTKDDQGVTRIVPDDSPARSLEIRLDEAVVSNAEESVSFRSRDTLTATVVEDGVLNLNGQLARGTFVKEGPGKAVLSHPYNEFYGGVTANGGILSVEDVRALGLMFADNAALSLKKDTFAYASSAAAGIPTKLRVSVETVTEPTVVRADGDITFKGGVEVTSGALVKGGAGKLTLEVANGQTLAVANAGTGTGANGCPQNMTSFNADGSFSGEHGALTVAEGTLAVVGTGAETVNANNALIAVGVQMANIAAQPKLTVDGVTLNNNMHLFVGGFVQPNTPSGFATTSTVEVVNGGVLKCDTLRVGFQSGSRGCHPFVHLDGGTLDAGFRVNCSDNQNNTHARYMFENGSVYKVGSYNYSSWQTYWEGDAEFVFDASTYAIAGNGHYGDIHMQNAGRGSMVFQNGSTAYVQTITKLSGDPWRFLLAFDASAWIPSAADHDFLFRGGEGMTVDCRAGGLILPVPAEATWTVHQKLTGEGAVVKEGAGTLVFDRAAYLDTYHGERREWDDPSSWAFEGVARIKAGTVEVRGGACPATAQAVVEAGAVFVPDEALAFGGLSGAGTVRGGGLVGCRISGVSVEGTTLAGSTVALTVDKTSGAVTGAPCLSDVTFSGRTVFDFGRTESDPLPERGFSCKVATYAGTPPDVSRWRVANVGFPNGRGTFVAANGVVTMTLERSGMMLLVR